jgi:hypothetical protein
VRPTATGAFYLKNGILKKAIKKFIFLKKRLDKGEVLWYDMLR